MTAAISILVAGSFISCGDDDDEVDVPIVTNPQVDNMLNSAEVTDFNCVSATLKGTMVSKQDLQRFYPKRFVMLSIMYMDADESNDIRALQLCCSISLIDSLLYLTAFLQYIS